MLGKEARHVLIHQPLLHFGDGKDIAIADDQIDVIERDAFGVEAIVDHLLIETGGVLFARDPLFGDGKRDRAVAQQAGTHIMVVGVEAENVAVLLRHRNSLVRDQRGILMEMILSGLRAWILRFAECHFAKSHVAKSQSWQA